MDFSELLRVMAMIFMVVMRIRKDKLKPRRYGEDSEKLEPRMAWSLGGIHDQSWTEPESTFPPEIEMEILESRTPGTHIPGGGELRILLSLTPGNTVPGWNGKMKPPEAPTDPLDSLTETPGYKETLVSLMTPTAQAT